MEVTSFSEIEQEFTARVYKTVFASVASIDRHNRVRSRILHPIWEHEIGWITTRRNSFKGKHFAHSPYVSVTYVDAAKPLYIDCRAAWADDLSDKQRVWDLVKAAPAPLGFDPTPIYKAVDDANFGLIKLTPWRIEVYQFPLEKIIWRPSQ